MRTWLSALALSSVFISGAFADSIDDAEAKRRGVPPIVIQLEKQTSAEKTKQAALQKQITDAQKELADLATGGATAAKAPATVDPQLPKPAAAGPRKASPVFDDVVSRYMAGNWSKLAGDIAVKNAQLTSLGAGNAADIAYIRAAMLECRPAWWERFKGGNSVAFEATAFNHKINVNWTAADRYSGAAAMRNGKVVVLASWSPTWIDNASVIDGGSGIVIPSGNFTQNDGTQFTIWETIAHQIPLVDLGDKGAALLEKSEERYVDLHRQLIGTLAGIYYAGPNSRRLYLAQCQNAFDPQRRGSILWEGRRYFTAFLVGEMLAHPDKYPSLKLNLTAQPDEIPVKMLPEEYLYSTFISTAIMSTPLTFAEDCALRQAIWEFAMANTDWTADHIDLPNATIIAFDADKEPDAAKARWTAFQKLTLPKAASAAESTPPATTPAP